jgi:hypothetical protein
LRKAESERSCSAAQMSAIPTLSKLRARRTFTPVRTSVGNERLPSEQRVITQKYCARANRYLTIQVIAPVAQLDRASAF